MPFTGVVVLVWLDLVSKFVHRRSHVIKLFRRTSYWHVPHPITCCLIHVPHINHRKLLMVIVNYLCGCITAPTVAHFYNAYIHLCLSNIRKKITTTRFFSLDGHYGSFIWLSHDAWLWMNPTVYSKGAQLARYNETSLCHSNVIHYCINETKT